MDPPYKEEKISILLNKINDANVLKSEGIIIIHRHKREKDEFPKEFNILEVKTYGMSKIIFGNYI